MNPNPHFLEFQNLEKKKRELTLLQFLILGLLTGAVIVLSLMEQKFLTLFFLGLLS
ncbi:MAG: hypothetical protein HY760_00755, partial [Nitrospirae bacterium]|nr:hypothetical protein [Nitrospirota bacterium]